MKTIPLNLTLARQLVDLSTEELTQWCEATPDGEVLPSKEVKRRKDWICALLYWKLGGIENWREPAAETLHRSKSQLRGDAAIRYSINRKKRLGLIK